jgi:hypothetical protein
MAQSEAAQEAVIDTESEYQDRTIKCVDCNENFIWTGGEQVFFHDKGLKNEPKRCKPCKQAKNERLARLRQPNHQAFGSASRCQSSARNAVSKQRFLFIHHRVDLFIVVRAFLAGRTPDQQSAPA